jgi:hypothetical protein
VLLELHPGILRERGWPVDGVLRPFLDNGYSGWLIDHSREVTRRAAYSKKPQLRLHLGKLSSHEDLGTWPHVLLLRDASTIDRLGASVS